MWLIITITVTAVVVVRRATDYITYSNITSCTGAMQHHTAAKWNNKRFDNVVPCTAVLQTAHVGIRFTAPTKRTAFIV